MSNPFTDDEGNASGGAIGAWVVVTIGIIAYVLLAYLGAKAPAGSPADTLSMARGALLILITPVSLSLCAVPVVKTLRRVERNTNGKSDRERANIAREAADHAIAAYLREHAGPNTPRHSLITPPSPDRDDPVE